MARLNSIKNSKLWDTWVARTRERESGRPDQSLSPVTSSRGESSGFGFVNRRFCGRVYRSLVLRTSKASQTADDLPSRDPSPPRSYPPPDNLDYSENVHLSRFRDDRTLRRVRMYLAFFQSRKQIILPNTYLHSQFETNHN
ncbi:hypothetical protein M8J77_002810 [Diaphorina citri]|nr:hypothetical protein M8J77_002810 [Diaphorina citri]